MFADRARSRQGICRCAFSPAYEEPRHESCGCAFTIEQAARGFGETFNRLRAIARARIEPRFEAWRGVGFAGWLRLALKPIVWCAANIWALLRSMWALLRWAFATLLATLRWLLVPKGDTPFDALKHYISVIVGVIGLTALLWAGTQIANPPIVITVAELPKPVREEHWLNTEISRALIDQIERMRAVVKSERDPTFEAVLNPPNIVIKSGDFSFNIQEQLLAPLGSLLGRSHGEAHIAATCYHPGCVRTSDSNCRDPVSPPTTGVGDAAKAPTARSSPQANQYLCLRVTADIRRGAVHKRVTTRLNL